MNILLIIIGMVLLIKGADVFVEGCSKLAKSFGIPEIIIGLTIVAFGTSAPEAAVSLTASIKGMNVISLGNVVGSNICNMLLVLGVSGVFSGLTTQKKIVTRDFVYAILAGVVLLILSYPFFINGGTTGVLNRSNGLILLCFLGIYLYALMGEAVKSSKKAAEKIKFQPKYILFVLGGMAGIIIGGQLVVDSATKLATALHVSQNLIALTVIAIGTSLPELVTSTVAASKGETDIAIGNVVGSNIFNIFFILGISSTVSPITYGLESFIDIIIMLFASILVYVLTLKNLRIGYQKGIILLECYILYMLYILVR